MKFEVRYPTGARHEVELQGTLVVLGRDPSCDLVLNDVKCSRRHAVIEAGAQGLAIRDTASANGIYVNGRRVERSALLPGDVLRLGEIVVKVLPEAIEGTLAMGPDELAALGAARDESAQAELRAAVDPDAVAAGPSAGSPPGGEGAAVAPATRAAAPAAAAARARVPRPLTLTLLGMLWALGVPLYGVGGLLLGFAAGLARGPALAAATGGFCLALLSAVMAAGVWARSPWARVLQLVLAAAGLVVCPFALASITVLVYLLRPEGRLHFSARHGDLTAEEQRLLSADNSEPAFAGTLFGAVVLGATLSVAGAYFVAPRIEREPAPAADAAALADVEALLAAQRNFRAGTASSCGLLYADLDGLLRPATVIPNYRADGPAFLDPEFAREVRGGYRFELEVSDRVPGSEGCPARAYRGFRYTAMPLSGRGRHFLTGPDGKLHAAVDRPATFTDPTVE